MLNIFNFQSLIATKAARVCLAAGNEAVIEFGLRRAQGVDGGLTAARAAYIGGCAGTSNLQAGERFGIPVSGTQAHSWIMFFEGEIVAWAEASGWIWAHWRHFKRADVYPAVTTRSKLGLR